MRSRVQQFCSLGLREQLLFCRVWLMLGRYRAATLLRPFKNLTRNLEHHSEQPSPAQVEGETLQQATRLGWLVAAAARVTPWQSPCLAQVLVLQRLLAGRGIPGQFYLGVAKGGNMPQGQSDLAAHAWLQCGRQVINGASGAQGFTVVSTYSWDARND